MHYKIAAIDSNFGTSATSTAATATITTAPATRTPLNYVGVYWSSVANAVGYLVAHRPEWRRYVCSAGILVRLRGFHGGARCGIIDKGAEVNTWVGATGFGR